MTPIEKLQQIIDNAWENRAQITNQNASQDLRSSVSEVIEGLNNGSRCPCLNSARWPCRHSSPKITLLGLTI